MRNRIDVNLCLRKQLKYKRNTMSNTSIHPWRRKNFIKLPTPVHINKTDNSLNTKVFSSTDLSVYRHLVPLFIGHHKMIRVRNHS